jgi:integrase
MSKTNWIMKFNVWIAPNPIRPGVWRRKEGGFLVRGRSRDPRTGHRIEVRKVYTETEDADQAFQFLHDQLRQAREGGAAKQPQKLPTFREYAKLLMERKIARGKLKSGKSRERWDSITKNHLNPAFGDFFIDQIRKTDVEDWLTRAAQARKPADGDLQGERYSPTTVNDWLALLRVILSAAVADYDLERNPVARVDDVDTSEHHTYTAEEPNSLTVDELGRFLVATRNLYPQHFGVVALGFATGLRPSSLRPLRRKGETPDVRWDEGMLLVRRSQTRKTVMETTKTGVLQNIALPADLMDVLRWHVERLDSGPELLRNSELLFPSEVGAFRSASCLDRPFREIAEAAGIKKHLTPRSMRRTFNDLCRRAEVRDVVTRSFSGHLTEGMQRHYSTVAADEQRASLAKVVSLAGFRAALLTERGTHPDAVQGTPNEYPGSASATGKMQEQTRAA